MAKAVIKTKETDASVQQYLNSISDETKRKDSFAIMEMMQKASGEKPKLWGDSLIGFGNVTIKSPTTGREVDWFRIGFAPRKGNISLYLGIDLIKQAALLKKLGKHKTGKGCLYINKLENVDVNVLKEMIKDRLNKK